MFSFRKIELVYSMFDASNFKLVFQVLEYYSIKKKKINILNSYHLSYNYKLSSYK